MLALCSHSPVCPSVCHKSEWASVASPKQRRTVDSLGTSSVMLIGEDLSRYLNKIESVVLRKAYC